MIISFILGVLLVEFFLDWLMNRVKVDILIEVVWNINIMGFKCFVIYIL